MSSPITRRPDGDERPVSMEVGISGATRMCSGLSPASYPTYMRLYPRSCPYLWSR